MNEREHAEEMVRGANASLDAAKTLLLRAIENVREAITEADALVRQAQASARQFNREVGRSLVLNDSCLVTFARIGPRDVANMLTAMADMKTEPCEISPGVRAKLSHHLTYKDCPRGSEVMVTEREYQKLEKDLLASRAESV